MRARTCKVRRGELAWGVRVCVQCEQRARYSVVHRAHGMVVRMVCSIGASSAWDGGAYGVFDRGGVPTWMTLMYERSRYCTENDSSSCLNVELAFGWNCVPTLGAGPNVKASPDTRQSCRAGAAATIDSDITRHFRSLV